MAYERVPGTDLTYHLIAFDSRGQERTDDPDGLMSRRLVDLLVGEPITDVFVMSHGWKGDVPAAREQYRRWITAMARCRPDIDGLQRVRPGFTPLLIGIHWPSLPWGDEELGPALAFDVGAPTPTSALIEEYAERLADTPTARAALAVIFTAALEDVAPVTLPSALRDAYEDLDREAGLGNDGVAGAPGADREPFDVERAYQASLDANVTSFGGADLGGVLAPLRQLSFWKMKQRAREFGEAGGHRLLSDLQKAATARADVRFHLMGHSFGCIAVSAMVAGSRGAPPPKRPVHSLALVQGAMSLWAYCQDIPVAPGSPGYFHPIITGSRVSGPIITTQSEHDTAVGSLYPWAAGFARHVDFVPGDLPKYGALGTFGIRGPGSRIVDLAMLPAEGAYRFSRNAIYNLEASNVICEGSGLSGAHSDIARPEVAHAVWQAALS